MEPREAAELVALMRGTWPNFAPDEVADRLWLEDLCSLDAPSALKTFRWLRDHEQFPPTWALFTERHSVDARPSIMEQIAIEGPRTPIRGGNGTYDEIRARQREERVMERIRNRPHHPQPIVHHFDALTHSYEHDEVYDENGDKIFEFGADGWPIE